MIHHSFSTFAKFSEKCTFLAPWYAQVRVIKRCSPWLKDETIHSFDNSKLTKQIFKDPQKIFDTINHNVILRKLSWFRSQVIFKYLFLGFLGSILDLLIFLMYVKDMSQLSEIFFYTKMIQANYINMKTFWNREERLWEL